MLCWGAELGFVPAVRHAGGLWGGPRGFFQPQYGQGMPKPTPQSSEGGTQGAVLVHLSICPHLLQLLLPAPCQPGVRRALWQGGCRAASPPWPEDPCAGPRAGLGVLGSGVRSPRPPARWPCQAVLAPACQEPRGGGRSWAWGHRAAHQVNKSPFMGTGGSWHCRHAAAGCSRVSVGQGTPCPRGDAVAWES